MANTFHHIHLLSFLSLFFLFSFHALPAAFAILLWPLTSICASKLKIHSNSFCHFSFVNLHIKHHLPFALSALKSHTSYSLFVIAPFVGGVDYVKYCVITVCLYVIVWLIFKRNQSIPNLAYEKLSPASQPINLLH